MIYFIDVIFKHLYTLLTVFLRDDFDLIREMPLVEDLTREVKTKTRRNMNEIFFSRLTIKTFWTLTRQNSGYASGLFYCVNKVRDLQTRRIKASSSTRIQLFQKRRLS